jgi:hypothetical protein
MVLLPAWAARKTLELTPSTVSGLVKARWRRRTGPCGSAAHRIEP